MAKTCDNKLILFTGSNFDEIIELNEQFQCVLDDNIKKIACQAFTAHRRMVNLAILANKGDVRIYEYDKVEKTINEICRKETDYDITNIEWSILGK